MDISHYLPTLVDYSPVNVSNSLSPEIYCKFNVKLRSDVFSTEGVNRYFSLFDESSKTLISLTFMRSEQEGKALRFYPNADLETNRTYTLNISVELPSKDNRKCDTGNTFSFTTKGSYIKAPVLLSPGYDAITPYPDFAWSIPAVSGTLSGSLVYELQICSNERFSESTGEFQYGPSAFVVSGNVYSTDLEDTHNYYWRVRAASLSGSSMDYGDWSGVSKFYLGSSSYTETQDFTLMNKVADTVTFGAVSNTEVISVNGDSNVASWPDLSIRTNLEVSMSLKRRSIDGYPDGYWREVAGETIQITGSVAGYVFDPAASIIPNHLYKLEISSSGVVTHTLIFSSRYTPLYASIYQVRNQLGDYIADMSDDEIYLNIMRVSLTANRHYYIYNPGIAPYYAPLESAIRNLVIANVPYAMGMWVEAESCARILSAKSTSMAYEFGHTSRLADFSEDNDVELLKTLRTIASNFRKDAEKWLAEFSKKRIPLLAVSMGDAHRGDLDYRRDRAYQRIVPRDWRY